MGNKQLKAVDLKDRKYIVTGANSGIGKATTKKLAEYGAHVVMGCRSKERAEEAIKEIKKSVPEASIEFMELDLGDLESVKKFAVDYLANHTHLDGLVNNAGMIARDYTKGKLGHPHILEVNHLGPMLLSILLKPALEKAPKENGGSRVVMVASAAHKFHKGKLEEKVVFNAKREGSLSAAESMEVYGTTKLCNLLFAKGWATELEKEGSLVTVYSIHPGWVATELSREAGDFLRGFEKMVARSPEEGSVPSLWCAIEPIGNKDLINGEYYTWIAEVGEKSKKAKRKELAEWLMKWSKEQLSEYLD